MHLWNEHIKMSKAKKGLTSAEYFHNVILMCTDTKCNTERGSARGKNNVLTNPVGSMCARNSDDISFEGRTPNKRMLNWVMTSRATMSIVRQWYFLCLMIVTLHYLSYVQNRNTTFLLHHCGISVH